MHAGNVEGHRGLASTAERKAAQGQAEMAKAAEARDIAKARRERLERGEDAPCDLGKPLTREDLERIFREAGFTASDIRHCVNLSALASAMDRDAIMQEIRAAQRRAEKAAVRAMLRRNLSSRDAKS